MKPPLKLGAWRPGFESLELARDIRLLALLRDIDAGDVRLQRPGAGHEALQRAIVLPREFVDLSRSLPPAPGGRTAAARAARTTAARCCAATRCFGEIGEEAAHHLARRADALGDSLVRQPLGDDALTGFAERECMPRTSPPEVRGCLELLPVWLRTLRGWRSEEVCGRQERRGHAHGGIASAFSASPRFGGPLPRRHRRRRRRRFDDDPAPPPRPPSSTPGSPRVVVGPLL